MITKVLMGMTLATAVVMQDGLIEVNVQEKGKDGTHVHLYVPATAATWGVHLAPTEKLKEHLRGHREQLQLARTVVKGLEEIPDATLLEVDTFTEHVRMEKRGGRFLLDVDDKGEVVHISVPIRAARKVLQDLEAEAPAS